jgi:putative oxidoreductase
MKLPTKIYALLIKIGRYVAPAVLLLIRLAWGWELIQSGHGHLTHLDQTTEFFQSLHIPMAHANAVISGTTELVCGALLLVGFGARLAAIPLIFNFCVAYLTASHDKVVHILDFANNGPSNFIDDTAFPFLVASLVIFAFGPGMLSIDGILARTVFRTSSIQAHSGYPIIP